MLDTLPSAIFDASNHDISNVIAGVVVSVATEPLIQFAVTTDTEVTVQVQGNIIFQLHNRLVPHTVFMLVPLTNVACLASKAVCVAVDIGLLASLVLSTLPNHTSHFTNQVMVLLQASIVLFVSVFVLWLK